MRDWHAAAVAEMDWPAWQAHVITEAHRIHDDIESAIGEEFTRSPGEQACCLGLAVGAAGCCLPR
jgi:hypothetical protein